MTGTAFSVLLICVSGWMVYKGTQFVRLHYLHREVAAVVGADPAVPRSGDDIDALRERIAIWRATPGLEYLARIDYRDAGKILAQPPLAAMRDAADVVGVDPVNGNAWMDLAQAGRRAPDFRPLALAAWQMSALAAPREYPIVLRRVAFLLGVWPTAEEEQKRQFFFETNVLSKSWERRFSIDWADMISHLPEANRNQIESEMQNYSSSSTVAAPQSQ